MVEQLTKVKFTNLNKIIFPLEKITKKQVIEYYIKIAPKILNILLNRAIVLNRFPNGINKKGFYEKNAPKGTPSWVKRVEIYSKTTKRHTNYILCNDLDTLIWLANLTAIELHIPLSTITTREKPDFIFFDIDPEPPASIKEATAVSLLIKDKLDKKGLKSYIKTSGKKGLHIIVPIKPSPSFEQTKKFVHEIGLQLTKENQLVVSELSDTKKPGKIFVDYLQNSLGRTISSPYSLRAKPKALVSTPLEWSEIKKGIKPAEFNIYSIIKRDKEPWKNILENKQEF
ncbi:non-homologous end-joining DNA ligase [Candidatus Bathyarchaeota archaeon]|nr:non-homologous end-joining DNA ligase [Candidatus Bathyarchaeota archaeon]